MQKSHSVWLQIGWEGRKEQALESLSMISWTIWTACDFNQEAPRTHKSEASSGLGVEGELEKSNSGGWVLHTFLLSALKPQNSLRTSNIPQIWLLFSIHLWSGSLLECTWRKVNIVDSFLPDLYILSNLSPMGASSTQLELGVASTSNGSPSPIEAILFHRLSSQTFQMMSKGM